MMSTTLIANNAKVYIIGPKQEDLDTICKIYNDQLEQAGKSGRMYGIEGDIRKKVRSPTETTALLTDHCWTASLRHCAFRRKWGSAKTSSPSSSTTLGVCPSLVHSTQFCSYSSLHRGSSARSLVAVRCRPLPAPKHIAGLSSTTSPRKISTRISKQTRLVHTGLPSPSYRCWSVGRLAREEHGLLHRSS